MSSFSRARINSQMPYVLLQIISESNVSKNKKQNKKKKSLFFNSKKIYLNK